MNKIQSPLIPKHKTQRNFTPSIYSSPQSHNKFQYILSPQKIQNIEYKQSPAITNISFYKYQQNKSRQQEIRDIRFSRFSNWHLTQMFDNRQIYRQHQTNRLKIHLYLQQSSQSLQQYNDNTIAIPQTNPTNYQSLADKQIKLYTTCMNNNNSTKISTQLDKLIKPKQTGLRKLSCRAYKIVKQFGEVTYKQVASRLIKQIYDNQSQFDDQKQQNNIKRRVYDALNVLISMGILNKIGKIISYGLDRNQQCLNILHKEKKQSLMAQLQTKKKQILQKKQQKKKLINKIKSLNQLIIRNKFKNIHEDNNIIRLAFICVEVSSNFKIRLADNGQICTLEVKNQHKVWDGLEVITRMFADKEKEKNK